MCARSYAYPTLEKSIRVLLPVKGEVGLHSPRNWVLVKKWGGGVELPLVQGIYREGSSVEGLPGTKVGGKNIEVLVRGSFLVGKLGVYGA